MKYFTIVLIPLKGFLGAESGIGLWNPVLWIEYVGDALFALRALGKTQ